jgi:hypothetical protein
MVGMYNGRVTDSNHITMQQLHWVNVIHAYMMSHTVLPNIATVHKHVKTEMEDKSKPHHKFTDLCRKFMWLKSSREGESPKFLFNVIIPIVSGHQQQCANVTYLRDNKEAAALVKKIRRSAAAWFFGYWQNVMGYRLAMVQKLMESFDINAALLAHFSEFNLITLPVQMTFGDVDEQLDSVEADLGIDQGWTVDLEEKNGDRVDVVGQRKALAMTLRNRIEDVDDAACSGPSCWLDFLHSTGNLTNNLEATIHQHTLREKALKNIELVNKNYHLENNPHEMQGKMASILTQNQLFREQLLAFNQGPSPSVFPMAPNNEPSDKENVPMSICGGKVTSQSQVPFWCDNGVLSVATSASLMEPALLFVDNTDRREKGGPPGCDRNGRPGKGRTGTDIHITGACMLRPTPIGGGSCPLPPRLRVSRRKLLFLPQADDSK